MVTPEYVHMMALYNSWQNEKLYELVATLGDEERRRERGMFFRSLHATLDHIGVIDRVIMEMVLTGVRNIPADLTLVVFDDFAQLRTERVRLDEQISELQHQPQEWLDTKGHPNFRFTRAFNCMQMFNHQTHHRSQVTSVLHTMGLDYGNTDLPFNPKLAP